MYLPLTRCDTRSIFNGVKWFDLNFLSFRPVGLLSLINPLSDYLFLAGEWREIFMVSVSELAQNET